MGSAVLRTTGPWSAPPSPTGGHDANLAHLGEVLVELWVEESHLRLHVLVQHQGEHWEHGVDGGITAQYRRHREKRLDQNSFHISGDKIMVSHTIKKIWKKAMQSMFNVTYPTMRNPWYKGTEAK